MRHAAAVDVDFPHLAAVLLHPLGVDVDHDALAAEAPGRLADELGIARGGRVDRHLVAAGQQQLANVFQRANAAADAQRHEDHFGRAAHDVEHDVAPLVAGRDVEKHQLVGPFLLVARGHLDRVAGVAQVDEVGPFDDPAPIDVETRNHALGKHGKLARREVWSGSVEPDLGAGWKPSRMAVFTRPPLGSSNPR